MSEHGIVFIRSFVIVSGLVLMECGDRGCDAQNLDLVGVRQMEKERKETSLKQIEKSAPKQGFHHRVLVVDLMLDLVFRKQRDGWTFNTPHAHVNLPKIRAGGVDIIFSALPMTPGKRPLDALDQALKITEDLVAGTDGKVEIVSNFKAARAAVDRGVVPMLLLLEGADALVGRLERIAELRKSGLAVIGLVAGRGNALADTSAAPRENGGLTQEGVKLLAACRDVNLVIDLTHASEKAFWDVLVEQSGTVIVSHTAVRALRDHNRNLDDLQILALSRYGGLMGLAFNPDFLRPGTDVKATLNDVVAHVMHVKAIGAVDALALGTDYGGVRPPTGLEDVSKLPRLTEALVRQGLSNSEIAGILGGNAARLFEDIERDRGAIKLTRDEILRPLSVECKAVLGELNGSPLLICDGYLLTKGPTLSSASRHKIRIRDMQRIPVRLELFGESGTPWQVEGQDLEGKVLLNRVVALDERGQGTLSLPSRRNLTRLFLSPTRPSHLREIVVWGH